MNASAQFRRATAFRQLHHVFRAHVLDSKAIGRDGQTASSIEASWELISKTIQKKMRDGSYEFTSYKEILISKGAQSAPRVVSIATARDRIVLKSLAGILVSIFPFAKTPMAQVRVAELAESLSTTTFDSFVRIDVKNFYPSIDHRAVFGELRKKIRQRQFLTLIARAISTPTVPAKSPRPNHSDLFGVPQGLPVSNLLAEVAMAQIDNTYGARSTIAYFRYVDDILLLCDEKDAQALFDDIELQCRIIGLEVHDLSVASKSQIGKLSEPFDYLGYRFSPQTVSVKPGNVQKIEATIAQLFTAYKYQAARRCDVDWKDKAVASLTRRLDLVIAGCVYENVPRGWLHYFSQLNDKTLLKRLDLHVHRLAKRFDLPTDFHPKSFVRAFWHITKPNSTTPRYIPNFDRFSGVDQREFLTTIFPGQTFTHLTVGELNKRFKAEVRRLVSKLERDISEIS